MLITHAGCLVRQVCLGELPEREQGHVRQGIPGTQRLLSRMFFKSPCYTLGFGLTYHQCSALPASRRRPVWSTLGLASPAVSNPVAHVDRLQARAGLEEELQSRFWVTRTQAANFARRL